MSVIESTPSISASAAPSGPDSLQLPASLFLTQWLEGVEIQHEWPVSVVKSATTGHESRWGSTDHPIRTIKATIVGFDSQDTWNIFHLLRRHTVCRGLFPLYSDHTKLTQASPSNPAYPHTLYCNTVTRRFFPGQRIAVGEIDTTCAGWGPRFKRFETGIVSGVTDTTITVQNGISEYYTEGTRVYPMLEVELMLTGAIRRRTNTVVEAAILLREVAGKSALLPLGEDGSVLDYEERDGLPVIELGVSGDPEFDISLERDVDTQRSGTSLFVSPRDPKARIGLTRQLTAVNRAEAWKVLALWERSGGSLRPFWASLPLGLIDSVSLAGNALTVRSGFSLDWDAFDHVAIKAGGVVNVYEIDSVVGPTMLLTETPPDLGPILWIRPAFKARFGRNSLTEKWVTDEMMEVRYEILEVLNDETVEVDVD